jgi:uncharacterized protein (DUF1684 family)
MLVKSLLLFFIFLTPLNYQSVFSQTDSSYEREMQQWKEKRMHALKSPGGWINLAGLYWLEPGKNSMGSDAENDFVCTLPDMPCHAGDFLFEEGQVFWVTAKGVKVKTQNKPVSKSVAYIPGEKQQPVFAMGAFRWNIIKRDDKLGVRLRDLDHPALRKVQKIDYFPVDTLWRMKARFYPGTGDSLMITNMIGQTHAQKSPGKFEFTYQDKTYTLDALENSAEDLLIVFGDLTNGEDTYASGRYIYIPVPAAGSEAVLDFNKAVNPPCVFTPYATCPIPPRQNRLPFAVIAGEKIYSMEDRQ